MSYSITVVTKDGKVISAAASGEVPDGTHAVSGHYQHDYDQVSVQRTDADGHRVVTASGTRHKEG